MTSKSVKCSLVEGQQLTHDIMCKLTVTVAQADTNGVVCLVQPRMTMARTLKLYKLPDKPKTPGIRLLEKKDIPQV